MEFIGNPEEYKSWSEESDDDDRTGIGRSYECVFCKRGFTTAQALGGHMNIHRKDRANNKSKPTKVVAPDSSSSNKLVDLGFYSHEPSPGNYYLTPIPEVDSNNYPQFYHHPTAIRSSSHQYHVHQFGGDWRTKSLSLYTNPFCLPDKIQNDDMSDSEDGLDLELRLGYQP